MRVALFRFPRPAGTVPRISPQGGAIVLNQDQVQAVKAPFPPEALSSDHAIRIVHRN